jgi:hypothetical protein
VRAMIGVFTPIIRNFLVACNSERNFENNISRTIHRRNQLNSPGLYTTKKIKSLRMFTHLMAIHDWHLLIHENKIVWVSLCMQIYCYLSILCFIAL